jgi:hypothetical protein
MRINFLENAVYIPSANSVHLPITGHRELNTVIGVRFVDVEQNHSVGCFRTAIVIHSLSCLGDIH